MKLTHMIIDSPINEILLTINKQYGVIPHIDRRMLRNVYETIALACVEDYSENSAYSAKLSNLYEDYEQNIENPYKSTIERMKIKMESRENLNEMQQRI